MEIKNIIRVSVASVALLIGQIAFAANTSANTSDGSINSTIENKLSSESSLSGATLNVNTANGVVTLAGTVQSDSQAATATEIAASVQGVTDVNVARLTVKDANQQPMADTFITAKIKGQFLQHKLFGDKDISAMTIKVETNNGVVSLTGTSDNQDQVNNAITIAKSIAGVKEVKSNVQVMPSNS